MLLFQFREYGFTSGLGCCIVCLCRFFKFNEYLDYKMLTSLADTSSEMKVGCYEGRTTFCFETKSIYKMERIPRCGLMKCLHMGKSR